MIVIIAFLITMCSIRYLPAVITISKPDFVVLLSDTKFKCISGGLKSLSFALGPVAVKLALEVGDDDIKSM